MPKYLVPIDLVKNELQNAAIQNLGTAPSGPVVGQIYTDTSGTPVIKFWDGTAWQVLGSPGGGTIVSVTALDSTITIAGTTSITVGVATGGITNTQINAAAAIDYSKLALTGSIVNADINASAAIDFSKLAVLTTDFDVNSHKITSLGTPTSATDAATKGYVDALVQGLSPKQAVIAASISNVSVSSSPSTLDGITLTAGDRILLKNQTAPAENGIYVFTATSSTLTRATDNDTWAEVPAAFCWVEKGGTNADTAWVCTSDVGGTLGTTTITFTKFANQAVLTATAPISITANAITIGLSARVVNTGGSLDLASGIVTPGTYQSITVDTYGRVTAGADIVSGNGIVTRTAAGTYVNRTITGTTNQITVTNGDGVAGPPTISLPSAARTSINATGFYSAAGTGTATSFTVAQATHGLGSSGNSFCDLVAAVYDITTNPAVLVIADITINTSTGAVTFTFAASTVLTNYRFTIIGK